MKTKALIMAISKRISEESVFVIDGAGFEAPSTKLAVSSLNEFGIKKSFTFVYSDEDEALFKSLGKNIDDTKEVLKLYGNMSSATVLYVLERFMDGDRQQGEKGLMLSFGPGFSAQRILLQW